MSKMSVITIMMMIAFATQAIAQHPAASSAPSKEERYFVSRILDVRHLILAKGVGPTALIYFFAPGDSVKVECKSCAAMIDDRDAHGSLSMQIKSASGEVAISRSSLGTWMGLTPNGGKMALVITREGFGKRLISLEALSIYRKTSAAAQSTAGEPIGLLEVSNLALPKFQAASAGAQTVFYLSFKDNENYFAKVVGANGTPSPDLIGSVCKVGEEFAKRPLSLEKASQLPARGDGHSAFAFAFAQSPSAKGFDYYHIEIDRIPQRSAGESSSQDR
jgi:hypothetical protein